MILKRLSFGTILQMSWGFNFEVLCLKVVVAPDGHVLEGALGNLWLRLPVQMRDMFASGPIHDLAARIVDLYIAPQSGPFFRNMNPATRNEAEVEAGKKALAKAMADLEHFTSAQGPWAAGASLTLADCTMLPTMLMTSGIVAGFGVPDLFAGLPKLGAWWKHAQADALTGPFSKEYLAAMAAFLASRRG